MKRLHSSFLQRQWNLQEHWYVLVVERLYSLSTGGSMVLSEGITFR